MNRTEKITKLLFVAFILVFSINVLSKKMPESTYFQESIASLEETQRTIMGFSGATLSISLAMSALPNDFASPLATTISDLNTYFVFMFTVLFCEKLMVIEGTRISLVYIIPIACICYMFFILSSKDAFRKLAIKLFILGVSVVMVIPFSTHFTDSVCSDYLAYVDETIAEAEAGATKMNEIMASDDNDTTLFDKLSDAFKSTIQGFSDLLTYFNNVIKKCVNSVAIMLVTTFVLPLLILTLFRWLLKELFAIHIPNANIRIRLPQKNQANCLNTHELPMEDKQ